ncbi:hypothetical protein [Nocardia sp. BMG51109]|uniref:hypothetical protein n=1 Tax=Nocardia sp. BMG51109 TaxID=1056816 RepID=UPI0004AD410B|nr:hypothetical protein [Nocardia sp. BMG51109]
MKPRKSTAILLAVWVATFVLYVFVKPGTAEHAGFAPLSNTISQTAVTTSPGR